MKFGCKHSLVFLLVIGASSIIFDSSNARSIRVTPVDVNTHAEIYVGHAVDVDGYVVLGDRGRMGGHVVMESEDEYKREIKMYAIGGAFDTKVFEKYCLNIENPEKLYRNISKYNYKKVIISGIIVDNNDELGSCSGRLALRLK